MTPGEIAELYVGHEILKSAYEYLEHVRGCKAQRLANVDALIIILDSRVVIQEELMNYMFREGSYAH